MRAWLTVPAALVALSGCNCGSTAPTITSFSASPASLSPDGGSVTLAWVVEGATSLSIAPAPGAVTPVTAGSAQVQVAASSTFTLSATNSAGTSTATASVCVASGPVTVTATSPTPYATCNAPFQSKLVLDNGSCQTVTVTSAAVSTPSTPGACALNGLYTVSASAAPGEAVTVLDLTNGVICCSRSPCTIDCSGAPVWTLTTNRGPLVAEANVVAITLSGCDQTCGATPDAGTPADAGSGQYSIGGHFVTASPSSGLVLATPGEPNLSNPPNPFTFAHKVPPGTAYDVTILTQPGGGTTCTVLDGGVGTVGNADVTDVVLACVIQLP
jgi:hypothetical protein